MYGISPGQRRSQIRDFQKFCPARVRGKPRKSKAWYAPGLRTMGGMETNDPAITDNHDVVTYHSYFGGGPLESRSMPNENIQIIASEGTSTGERILRLSGRADDSHDLRFSIGHTRGRIVFADRGLQRGALHGFGGAWRSGRRVRFSAARAAKARIQWNERAGESVTGDDARRQAGAAIRNSRGRYRGYDHPELKT